jgi:hypothetical protein
MVFLFFLFVNNQRLTFYLRITLGNTEYVLYLSGMKRNPHSYKISDVYYKKAMKRASKNKINLANMVEHFVAMYAEDADMISVGAFPGADAYKKENSLKKQ